MVRLSLGFAAIVFALLGAHALASPRPAAAVEMRSGDEIEVPAGERIDDDLYVAGGRVVIAGTVTGDVIAAAGEVRITGEVGGSLNVLGGTVEVAGQVDGSVRALSGDVTISGAVGRDVLAGSGSVTLLSTGSIGRDVIAAGGDVELLGPVGRRVSGGMGRLTINGRVGDDVEVTAEEISLLSRANIQGDFIYASGNEAAVADGAVVGGATERSEPDRFSSGSGALGWLSNALFRLLAGLVAGLVLVLLMPRVAASVADAARLAPLTSFLLGILLAVFLPLLIGVLLVTVVGIPIALILLAVFASVLYLSQVVLGLAIGRAILPSSWDVSGRGYNLLAMALGVCILAGLRMIPVPFLATAVAAISATLALGAVAVAIRAGRRRPTAAA